VAADVSETDGADEYAVTVTLDERLQVVGAERSGGD